MIETLIETTDHVLEQNGIEVEGHELDIRRWPFPPSMQCVNGKHELCHGTTATTAICRCDCHRREK